MALDKFQPYSFVSAGEQSNKFLTPTYADGIAQFQAQRAQSLTGLTVRIDPVQEGTGDPSPDNIRPISGRTGLTVTRAGKNLFDGVFSQQSPSQIQSATFTLPAGTYTYSQKYNGTPTWGIYVKGPDNTDIAKVYNVNNATFTLSQEESVRIRVYYVDGITPANITEAQIEIGSTATAYTPYVAPTTYPITWETEAGTVYGGTLDVVSGVLTVDKEYYTVTDADTPVLFQTGANANRVGVVVTGSAISPTAADRLNIMSNIAKADTSILTQSQQAIGTCCLYSAGSDTASKALFGVPTTEDTAAKAKSWLIAQGCAFVYPLATPQTYRLTGADVRTIAGYNQIYSDAGPVIDIKF